MEEVISPNPYEPLANDIDSQNDSNQTTHSLASEIRERKRKTLPSLDSEESNSPISKRINQVDSDNSFEEPKQKTVKMEEQLEAIQRRLDTLATSNELSTLRENFRTTLSEEIAKLSRDIDHWSSNFKERMENVEGRMLEAEARVEETVKENTKLRQELNALKNDLTSTHAAINDQQQYQRRWNLRIFNVPEIPYETSEQTTKKVCEIFSDLVGVPTTPEDIEVAHRVKPVTAIAGDAMQVDGADSQGASGEGPVAQVQGSSSSLEQGDTNQNNVSTSKPSSIIVRFKFRGKRDQIIKQRSNLKKKNSKVSISEDLTRYNMNVCNLAYKHPNVESTWSVNGKIFCKLKSGKKFVIPYGVELNHFIAMKARG